MPISSLHNVPIEQQQSCLYVVTAICNDSKAKKEILDFFFVGVVGAFFFFSFTQLWRKQIRLNTVATICGETEAAGGFGRHVLFVLLPNLRHN